MHRLIVGGTSGLGLELARSFRDSGDDVTVTGRRELIEDGLDVVHLDLAEPELPARIGEMVMQLPEVNSLVYAAGYYQEGRVTDLSDEQIEQMLSVGGRGLIYATREVLAKQDRLDELITITSTSQWTPRELEPIYNYTKAGEAHFSHAIAQDPRVEKVLVVGPAGMDTDFWRDREDMDTSTYNDPADVATEIMELRRAEYGYRFAKILRDPLSTEIVETS